jgi:polysaccharide biosynthesis protein PslA
MAVGGDWAGQGGGSATRRAYRRGKALTEPAVALALLILLMPVLALIGLLLKRSGPVLFRQTRLGQHGRAFTILKFRTLPPDRCDATGLTPPLAPDALGRFLRLSGLDELPQLINVLRGDMALVGPRPLVPGMLVGAERYDLLFARYGERMAVRPGLTGLAQIQGMRGPLTCRRQAALRLALDLDYVARASVWLDLMIIVRTPIELIRGVRPQRDAAAEAVSPRR